MYLYMCSHVLYNNIYILYTNRFTDLDPLCCLYYVYLNPGHEDARVLSTRNCSVAVYSCVLYSARNCCRKTNTDTPLQNSSGVQIFLCVRANDQGCFVKLISFGVIAKYVII